MFATAAAGLIAFVALGAAHGYGLGSQGASQTAEPPNDVITGMPALLNCAESILEEHGESPLHQVAQPDRVLTWPHQVDADELARVALLTDPDRAEWLDGTYQIQVTAAPAGAGAQKFEVEARILGRQTTSLPVLRPSTWQRLESSGALEQEISAELAPCSSPADQIPQSPPASSAAEQ